MILREDWNSIQHRIPDTAGWKKNMHVNSLDCLNILSIFTSCNNLQGLARQQIRT